MAKCVTCRLGIPAAQAQRPWCGAAAPKPESRGGKVAPPGVLGVVVILSVVCLSLGCGNFQRSAKRTQARVAMGHVRAIATAAEAYAKDCGGYPVQETLGLVSGIQKELVPVYINRLPPLQAEGPFAGRMDGFYYMSKGRAEQPEGQGEKKPAATGFLLIWAGPDGKLDPETEDLLKPGPDGVAKIWTMAPRRSAGAMDDVIWIDKGYTQSPDV